jgi:hypothetical protein
MKEPLISKSEDVQPLLYADFSRKRNKMRCKLICKTLFKNLVLIGVVIGLQVGVAYFGDQTTQAELMAFNSVILSLIWQALAAHTVFKVLRYNMGIRCKASCCDSFWHILLIFARVGVLVYCCVFLGYLSF